jgi:hypothetical protein
MPATEFRQLMSYGPLRNIRSYFLKVLKTVIFHFKNEWLRVLIT